jgi:hypothetical protein
MIGKIKDKRIKEKGERRKEKVGRKRGRINLFLWGDDAF